MLLFAVSGKHVSFYASHKLSISLKFQDIMSICKRRGGSDYRNLTHNEWLHTVQLEPDAISMSFIPITSLLNGITGSGFLSHAINLYLRCEYRPFYSFTFQFPLLLLSSKVDVSSTLLLRNKHFIY